MFNTYRVRNHFIPNPINSKLIRLKKNFKKIKSKNQNIEKAELWRVEVPLRFICTSLYLHFHHPLFAVKIYRPNSGFRFLGNILKCHLHYEFHLYISFLSTCHLVTILTHISQHLFQPLLVLIPPRLLLLFL